MKRVTREKKVLMERLLGDVAGLCDLNWDNHPCSRSDPISPGCMAGDGDCPSIYGNYDDYDSVGDCDLLCQSGTGVWYDYLGRDRGYMVFYFFLRQSKKIA